MVRRVDNGDVESSPTRLTAPELNDGEGASPSGRGAAARSGEALEPMHGREEG
jgi:hypothetical protein